MIPQTNKLIRIFRSGVVFSSKYLKNQHDYASLISPGSTLVYFNNDHKQLTSIAPRYSFAKIGKKKQEKVEKEKEKSQANLPSDIDLNQFETIMKKDLEATKNELSKLKAGRLTPDTFDKIMIGAYGQKTAISELAQVVPKSANTIALSVFDETLMNDINKVLENNELNFQLKREGKVITCTLVGVNTKEMKENTIKSAKQLVENYKQKLRKHRLNGIEYLKQFKKFSSEDVIKKAEDEVQEMFSKYSDEVDKVLKNKEKEILSG